MRYLALVGVLAILTILTGCEASRTLPVKGTVTLDGQPVAAASVAFRPQDGGRMSTGETDAEGNFTLTGYELNDGAIPGTHAVTVTKFEEGKAKKLPPGADEVDLELMSTIAPPVKKKWIVPEKYSDQKTSGLTFTVEKGKDTAIFDLKSN